MLSRFSTRRSVLFTGTLLLLALGGGCGVALTGGILGGVLLGKKSSGGGGANNPTRVDAASAAVDPLGVSPVVSLAFTISDAESDPTRVEVRYSIDPNDNSQKAFAGVATGTFLSGASTVTSPLATTPGGSPYVFAWNTAPDLGAKRVQDVRLQLVIDGVVGFTVSPFTVDNSGFPLVTTATVSPLPGGATTYSDLQPASAGAGPPATPQLPRGFIPVQIAVAQAQSIPVQLLVQVTTDGINFSTAVGKLVDGSGVSVNLNSVPTTPAGTAYAFQFDSGSSGIGTNGPASNVKLRFTASDTKPGPATDTTPFTVDNAFFTASIFVPTRITDKVSINYLLFNTSSSPLDVRIFYSLSGVSGAFLPATEIVGEPPDSGSQQLSTSPGGKSHNFVWNAFLDMTLAGSTFADSSVAVEIFVTNRQTQVTKGPFTAGGTFSVDERFIETVFGRSPLIVDNIAATTAELGAPTGIASLRGIVYFADPTNNRVRSVDLTQPTPLIETFFGSGTATSDGQLGINYALLNPRGLASSSLGTGAIYVSGDVVVGAGLEHRLFRVDGSNPVVTTLLGTDPGFVPPKAFAQVITAVAYEPLKDELFMLAYTLTASTTCTLVEMPASGASAPTVVAGGGPDSISSPVMATTAALFSATSVAANWNVYPDLVFYTEPVSQGPSSAPRVRVVNTSATLTHKLGNIIIPTKSISTLVSSQTKGPQAPFGISIEGLGSIDFTDVSGGSNRIWRLDDVAAANTFTLTALAGQSGGQGRGFGGDGKDARNALLSAPEFLTGDGTGGILISDTGNQRIRHIFETVAPIRTIITTAAGTFPNVGDGLPATQAVVAFPGSVSDNNNAIVVTDVFGSRIRSIDNNTTLIATLAGTGDSELSGDGGAAAQAGIGFPAGLVRGNGQDFYFSDPFNVVVRVLNHRPDGTYGINPVAGVVGTQAIPQNGALAATSSLDFPQALGFTGTCVIIGQGTGNIPGPNAVLSPSVVSAVNVGTVTTSGWGLSIAPGHIVNIAGGGSTSVTLAPIPASSAFLETPVGIAATGNGTIYISDVTQHAIYALASDGTIRVAAGTPGTPGDSADGVAANTSPLFQPSALALDNAEHFLFLADSGNDLIRVIHLSNNSETVCGVSFAAGTSGNMRILAGTDGVVGATGDGGPALGATVGLTSFGTNMLFKNGLLFYGDNPAGLNGPNGVTNFGRIRVIDKTGTIRTYGGGGLLDGDGKPADVAHLSLPTALVVAPNGTYMVADLGRVRAVPPDTTIVTRVAGTGATGASGDGGTALDATIDFTPTTPQTAPAVVTSESTTTTGIPNGARALALSGVGYTSSLLAIADSAGRLLRLVNLGPVPVTLPVSLSPPSLNGVIAPGMIASVDFSSTSTPSPLGDPEGVAFGRSFLFVSELGGPTIRVINLSSAPALCGNLSILSGDCDTLPGFAAGTDKNPRSLSFDDRSGLLFYQCENSSGAPEIRAFNTTGAPVTAFGAVIASSGTRVILTAGGASTPRGIAVDPATGDLYYADRGLATVSMIPAATGGAPVIVAGIAGNSGFTGDGGLATNARLAVPLAVGVDGKGGVYILDGSNFRVRRCRTYP